MKILLTGASGLVGSAFAKAAARRKHEIIGIVGEYSGHVEGVAEAYRIDLLDQGQAERKVLNLFPDVIVNCAAFSFPSQCEQEPRKSHRLNVELPEQLAALSKHLFAKFIHLSSEQVFDGQEAPYSLSDRPSAVNLYAKQKAESEEKVHHAAEEFAITLRIPLLNGNSLTGARSLHERLLKSWADGEKTPLFVDEWRQVCSAENLASVMVEIIERDDLRGIYHWAGLERLSRHQMGERIAAHFGLSSELIVKASREDNETTARRQFDLSMDLQPLDGILKTRPQTFEQQLESLIVPKSLRTWYHSI